MNNLQKFVCCVIFDLIIWYGCNLGGQHFSYLSWDSPVYVLVDVSLCFLLIFNVVNQKRFFTNLDEVSLAKDLHSWFFILFSIMTLQQPSHWILSEEGNSWREQRGEPVSTTQVYLAHLSIFFGPKVCVAFTEEFCRNTTRLCPVLEFVLWLTRPSSCFWQTLADNKNTGASQRLKAGEAVGNWLSC